MGEVTIERNTTIVEGTRLGGDVTELGLLVRVKGNPPRRTVERRVPADIGDERKRWEPWGRKSQEEGAKSGPRWPTGGPDVRLKQGGVAEVDELGGAQCEHHGNDFASAHGFATTEYRAVPSRRRNVWIF